MTNIASEVKAEILQRVKQGEKVAELSKQYGVSEATIYYWLKTRTKQSISLLAYNKLMRENRELKAIIGALMVEVERGKKKKD